MRGALFIVILIAMLIVGVLVIKNMRTSDTAINKNTAAERIDRAKDAAKKSEGVMKKIRDAAKAAQ